MTVATHHHATRHHATMLAAHMAPATCHTSRHASRCASNSLPPSGGPHLRTGIFSPPRLPSAAVGVAAGRAHSVVLCDGGGVWAWGGSSSGECGCYSAEPLPHPTRLALAPSVIVVQAVSACAPHGHAHAHAHAHATCTCNMGMHMQVAAGQLHTVLLTADGAVLCCGAGGGGALGTGELCDSAAPRAAQLPERARAVAAGGFHSLAVGAAASRIVYGWGAGASGQLGIPCAEFLPPPAEEEAGAVAPSHAALQARAARQARQAAARHAPRATPCALAGAPRCAMIAAGGYHSLILSQQVLAACWLRCACTEHALHVHVQSFSLALLRVQCVPTMWQGF